MDAQIAEQINIKLITENNLKTIWVLVIYLLKTRWVGDTNCEDSNYESKLFCVISLFIKIKLNLLMPSKMTSF